VKKTPIVIFCLIVLFILLIPAFTSFMVWENIPKGLDLKGGFEVLYEAVPEKGQKITTEVLKDAANAINKRVNILGVSEPDISVEPPLRIRVQIAGIKDQSKARKILGKPAQLTFRDPTGKIVLIRGNELKEGGAKLDYDQTGKPLVTIKFKDAKKFEDITRKYVGQPLTIYLDDTLLSSPQVLEPIPSGSAQITGQKAVEDALTLVNLLNAGAIPVKLIEKQSFAVDASLGKKALTDILLAGFYAIIAITVFVIGYYRLPGLIAVISLIAYSYLVLLTFMLLNVTLTLAGIAAFILGIGIAVDANIIMNERIREEARLGIPLHLAIKQGSRRSFRTIVDANVTTLLAAFVLFYFGTSSIRGFSVALIVGIVISFLASVFLSRLLMNLLVKANVFMRPNFFGVRKEDSYEL